ncbi:MAG: cytochrome c oxidase accessory protein CcoG [bacterium]|jgi:cytochrome c oxidase accessory protein FixG|nr:cytochrome c oxidase accessory protein CcoG [bacterium]
MSEHSVLEAPERVLSTLNKDGSRRWLRPRLARGPWQRRRLVVAWLLIALFTLMPILRLKGKPLMLLDLAAREFTLFGATFHATDTLFLMLLMVGILLSIFLLTALLGRVWCGWGCPQTVYMEYVFRPLERLIEGDHLRQHELDQGGGASPRRMVKHLVFLLISVFLANTFLAYWVGWDRLLHWISGSPLEHWAGFLVMAVTATLVFGDFAWFREQTCIVACPYGRLQSVLLDRHSLIVAYDARRGEPRAKWRRQTAERQGGDCIDCHHCVVVCPTGIDIRAGLQMECIHCTQCMDACDTIMDRIGRPRRLIRYGSQAELETGVRRFLRPRVVLYPLALGLVLGLLVVNLMRREDTVLTMLRGLGTPYSVMPGDSIANTIRLKVDNQRGVDRQYWIRLAEPVGGRAIVAPNPLAVAAGRMNTATIVVLVPRTAFDGGGAAAVFEVEDGLGYQARLAGALLGPASHLAGKAGEESMDPGGDDD